MKFKELVAADLMANVGRRGFLAGLSAFVYHPGFCTMLLHRTAKELATRGWPRLGNIVWRVNVIQSGCHIHLSSDIAPGLVLPHPTGVIVGSNCRLGPNVTLYQNVTLGRSHGKEVYPTLEAGVTVYPNSVIVGDIVVGTDAVVGAGSIVIASVPSGTVVAGNPAKPINHRDRTTSE